MGQVVIENPILNSPFSDEGITNETINARRTSSYFIPVAQFFVRHAYFCGAGEPYEKLKRALRSEINETAWNALYSTKSFPFDPPSKGKIAIKAINHYGDEVMRVFDLSSAIDSLRDS